MNLYNWLELKFNFFGWSVENYMRTVVGLKILLLLTCWPTVYKLFFQANIRIARTHHTLLSTLR